MLVSKIYSALGNKKKAEAQKVQEQELLKAKQKEQENQIQIFTNHNQINMFIVEVMKLMKDGRYRSAISKIYSFFNSDQCIQISSVQTLKLIRRYFACLSYIIKKAKASEGKPSESKLKTLFLLLKRANELLNEQNRIILTLVLKGQSVHNDKNPNINRLSIQMELSLQDIVKMSQRSVFKGLISYDSELKNDHFDFQKHISQKNNPNAQQEIEKEEKKFDINLFDNQEDELTSTERAFKNQSQKQQEQEERKKKQIQKKKILFQTKCMIVYSLKLCQFWAFYFKQKNMISQYALSLRKALDLCNQVQGCWEDEYQKEMVNIKIEVSNFYFEQQSFNSCQKMMNKVWDNILQQFNIKQYILQNQYDLPQKQKMRIMHSFHDYISLVITVLGNMALLEEYQGNFSRLTECIKLQFWLAHNYLEGIHDDISIICSNNLKNAQKKYAEFLTEEGEILRVLDEVFGIKQEKRNKLKFNTCEDQFQEELNYKFYKKYKIEKLNKALVILHKRSKSATKEDLMKAYHLDSPKNKLMNLLKSNQEEQQLDAELQQENQVNQKQISIQLYEDQLIKNNSNNTTLSTRLSESLGSPFLTNISQNNDFLKESFLSPLQGAQFNTLGDSQEKKIMIDIIDNIKEEEDFVLSQQQAEKNQMQKIVSMNNLTPKDKLNDSSKITDKPSYTIKRRQLSFVKRPPKQIQKVQFQYGVNQPVVLTTNKYWEPQKLYSETPIIEEEKKKQQESYRKIQSENNLDEKVTEVSKKQTNQPLGLINIDKYFKEFVEKDLNSKQTNFSLDFIKQGINCIMEDERFDNKEFYDARKFIEFKLKFRQAVKDGDEELNFNRGKIGLRELVHREFLDLQDQEAIYLDFQKKKQLIKQMQDYMIRQKQTQKQTFAQRFMNHRQTLNLHNVYDTKQENERILRIKEKREQKLATLFSQKLNNNKFEMMKMQQEQSSQNQEQKSIQHYKEFAKKGINLIAESTFNNIQKSSQEIKKIIRKSSQSLQVPDQIITPQLKTQESEQKTEKRQKSPQAMQLSSISITALRKNSEISYLNINSPSSGQNQNSLLWSDCFYNKVYYNQLASSCNMFGTKQAAKKAKGIGDIASLALKMRRQNGQDATKKLFNGQEQKRIRKKTVHRNILELIKNSSSVIKKITDQI
ncbi:hypothetical protein TTHERM_01108590 (macronuclear) [Tetrahymena thermophila SB210]|uniref:Uncharacterized protein n=1 Tax=Tetrahymena thermophila (strain SB210) TaxID=312017 RepID=Q22B96_TETTS|nr:hypothetical protein TTHERM_01108590 [Tetrahymena thermophila SB210]EAR82557.2 hypothetical protein TTHERM_01108590 [Tetrahymena thermophila SB210]|eukprot:XP_001030220.2 hypothetical protein TTHERM_01108590 [Tetrahymena thermophila SB210]